MSLSPRDLVLDRYVVERMLGKGAMGQVYLAHHELLEMPVAVKVLLSDDHDELRERFAREAKLMARVRHANVVQILDYGFLPDGAPCIVMEYLDGRELSEARRPAPWGRAVDCVAQILEGLTAVHDAGVLHRDLKPSNVVMVGERGGTAKLVDFGIARPVSRGEMRLTQTGMLIGTPAFMSPEQLMGADDVDASTDVYAAGLILYELLQGTLPFGASMNAIMKRLRHEIPPPQVPESRRAWPDALSRLLSAMLSFDPGARPSTTKASAALRALSANRSLGAGIVRGARAGSKTAPAARPRRADQGADPPRAGGTWVGHAPRASERDLAMARTIAAPPTPAPVSPAESARPVLSPVVEGDERVRAVIVVKMPSSRLRSREERGWLSGLLGTNGRGFTMGAQLWIAIVRARHDDPAGALAGEVAAQVSGRYGHMAEVDWMLVGEGFSLTGATLSGAAPLPDELSDLIEGLHG
jgi:serine/threonine protein kinase